MLGLLAAVVAVLVGIVLTIVLWRVGYIAEISGLVIAVGACYLYAAAAGAPPRRGLVPLVLLILLGVVASFFAVMGSDLYDIYDQLDLQNVGISRVEFIEDNIFQGEMVKDYGKDFALFAVFAALGIFGSLRRLLSS